MFCIVNATLFGVINTYTKTGAISIEKYNIMLTTQLLMDLSTLS